MSESIIKLTPNFTDSRGYIQDIFTNNSKEHCTLITNNDGAIRANHYHKLSTQFTFIISGKIEMATVNVDKKGIYEINNIKKCIIEEGFLVTHKPFEAHAFKSIGDSVILAFACGLRGGDQYENDVFRLKIPLIC